jgi:hypothetical protein
VRRHLVYSIHFSDDIQEMQERLSPKPWHPNISAAFYEEQQDVFSFRRSLKPTDTKEDGGIGPPPYSSFPQEITEADLAANHPDFGPRQLELAFTTETDTVFSETSLPMLASTLLHPDTLLPLPFHDFLDTQDQETQDNRSSPVYVNHVGETCSRFLNLPNHRSHFSQFTQTPGIKAFQQGMTDSTAPCVSSSHFIYLLNCAYHDPDFNLAWDEEDPLVALDEGHELAHRLALRARSSKVSPSLARMRTLSLSRSLARSLSLTHTQGIA